MQFMIRIAILLVKKRGIAHSINHNFARIRTDSCNSLSIEKTLTFHNVIILIKSVFNKNKDNYFRTIFLEKGFYDNKSYTHFFK